MLQQKALADPREYCRFKALDGVYVLLKMQQGEKLGFLRDFSSGGLAFEYIPAGEPIEEDSRIDVVMDEKKIHIEIPRFKKIFEIEVEDEFYSPVKFHRVGVQFKGLDPRKLTELAALVCPEQNPI